MALLPNSPTLNTPHTRAYGSCTHLYKDNVCANYEISSAFHSITNSKLITMGRLGHFGNILKDDKMLDGEASHMWLKAAHLNHLCETELTLFRYRGKEKL